MTLLLGLWQGSFEEKQPGEEKNKYIVFPGIGNKVFRIKIKLFFKNCQKTILIFCQLIPEPRVNLTLKGLILQAHL